jgi:hypothetical protein
MKRFSTAVGEGPCSREYEAVFIKSHKLLLDACNYIALGFSR